MGVKLKSTSRRVETVDAKFNEFFNTFVGRFPLKETDIRSLLYYGS